MGDFGQPRSVAFSVSTGGLGGLGLLNLPELVGGGFDQRPELGGRQVVDTLSRPVHYGAPTIGVTARVGETLTSDTSDIADADGMTNAGFTYRWIRNDGTADTDIQGAPNSAYTLVDADEGSAIRVRVSFTDDAGGEEMLTSEATASVAAMPATLTAEILDAPVSHDGQTAFTFELRFSEGLPVSYRILRDHAFTVTGGEVTGARRLERDSSTPNIRSEITVRPNGDGDVTITLPATLDCADQAAICTEDGRKLSGELVLTVEGPG